MNADALADTDQILLATLRDLFDTNVVAVRFDSDVWHDRWSYAPGQVILSAGKRIALSSDTLGRDVDDLLERYGATGEGRWLLVHLHTGEVIHGRPDDDEPEIIDRLAGLCSCGMIVMAAIAAMPVWSHAEDARPHRSVRAVPRTVTLASRWDIDTAREHAYPHPYRAGTA